MIPKTVNDDTIGEEKITFYKEALKIDLIGSRSRPCSLTSQRRHEFNMAASLKSKTEDI